MTSPDDPLRHVEGDPFWREAREGAQAASPESQEAWREALGPPLIVSRWLPGEDIDPSQIPATVDREAFARERQGNFVHDDFSRYQPPGVPLDGSMGGPTLAPAWEPYVGPHPEEAELYAQMRERQARALPAITRADLQRQGLLPPDPIQARISDDVHRALMGGASMETVQARLRELGFEYIGDMGPEGVQRTPLPELVSGDIIQRAQPEEFRIEDVYAAIRAVHAVPNPVIPPMPEAAEPPLTDYDRVYADGIVPLEDLPAPSGNRAARRGRPGRGNGCQCGNPANAGEHTREACTPETQGQRARRLDAQRPGPLPWRMVGHDVERHTVDVEFTNETPVGRDGDPLTAIRTRPLGGGGAGGSGGGGYAPGDGPDHTTWAVGGAAGGGGHAAATARASGFGMAGAGGDPYLVTGTEDSLRDRLMRHGVTAPPDLDVGVEVAAQSAPAEPRWLEPAPARRAQAHMDEIFAELDTKSKGELLDLIADMRKDWKMLNEIHNSRANRSSWCVEYEERQEIHNQKLRVLKLIGRIYDGPTDNENEGRGL